MRQATTRSNLSRHRFHKLNHRIYYHNRHRKATLYSNFFALMSNFFHTPPTRTAPGLTPPRHIPGTLFSTALYPYSPHTIKSPHTHRQVCTGNSTSPQGKALNAARAANILPTISRTNTPRKRAQRCLLPPSSPPATHSGTGPARTGADTSPKGAECPAVRAGQKITWAGGWGDVTLHKWQQKTTPSLRHHHRPGHQHTPKPSSASCPYPSSPFRIFRTIHTKKRKPHRLLKRTRTHALLHSFYIIISVYHFHYNCLPFPPSKVN